MMHARTYVYMHVCGTYVRMQVYSVYVCGFADDELVKPRGRVCVGMCMIKGIIKCIIVERYLD